MKRGIRKIGVWAFVLALGLGLGLGLNGVGCSDDSAGDEVDAAVEADAAVDASIPVGRFTLRVCYWTGDATGDPVQGAAVAFDKPGGDRVEATTGVDGRVSFEEIDWSLGTASFTVHAEGHQLMSWAGFDESHIEERYGGGEPWVGIVPLDPFASTVEATGYALNMRDPDNSSLLVTALGVEDWSAEWATGEWLLHVPPDTPFTLVALERQSRTPPSMRGSAAAALGWVTVPHAGIGADTTGIPIDFAGSTDATHTTSGSIVLPTDPQSPLRAGTFSNVRVSSEDSAYYSILSLVTYIDISTDENSFEYDLEWIEPADATAVMTAYQVWAPAYRYGAWVNEPGYPTGGARTFDFLNIPRLVTPTDSRVDHGLHSPMEWELFDTGVSVSLIIYRGDQIVWRVGMPKDAVTCTVPEPPSTVDVPSLLGTGRLIGILFVSRDEDPSNNFIEKGARVSDIYLLLP